MHSREPAAAPTPVLLPGKPHGRRSLVGCSPGGRTGSDTTERLSSSRSMHSRCFLLAVYEINSDKLSAASGGWGQQVCHVTDGKTEVWRQGLCYWQAESLGCLKYVRKNVLAFHMYIDIYLTYIVHSNSIKNRYGVINRKRILDFYFLMCTVCGHLCPRAHAHTPQPSCIFLVILGRGSGRNLGCVCCLPSFGLEALRGGE